ncbi:MAG TPA: hypothetical protein VGR47_14235 [Terracidiphilus sp.]|nr:hypothetical protein [Terracidiphilus sp.]
MRRTVAMVLVLVFLSATNAFGVTGSEVMYVGGSVEGLKPGDIGTFDTRPEKDLDFVSNGRRVSVAYDKIQKIQYRKEVAHHFGVALAIAVALIKKRERKHFITLSFTNEAGEQQAALFEVSKRAPQSLLAVLAARAPQACVILQEYQSCPAAPRTFATGLKP